MLSYSGSALDSSFLLPSARAEEEACLEVEAEEEVCLEAEEEGRLEAEEEVCLEVEEEVCLEVEEEGCLEVEEEGCLEVEEEGCLEAEEEEVCLEVEEDGRLEEEEVEAVLPFARELIVILFVWGDPQQITQPWEEGDNFFIVTICEMRCVAFHGRAHPFSNFHPSRFVVDGQAYACVEQFMMAEKARMFGDDERLREIMNASSPLAMKRLGRRVTPFDAARWDGASCEVVRRALEAKFTQNPELGHALQATGDALIVEASPRDRLWGAGLGKAGVEAALAEGRPLNGRNRLGVLLMRVRDELRRIEEDEEEETCAPQHVVHPHPPPPPE